MAFRAKLETQPYSDGYKRTLQPSLPAAQGVCRAGKMLGLDDSRTGLVREIYRLIDSLPSLSLSLC